MSIQKQYHRSLQFKFVVITVRKYSNRLTYSPIYLNFRYLRRVHSVKLYRISVCVGSLISNHSLTSTLILKQIKFTMSPSFPIFHPFGVHKSPP